MLVHRREELVTAVRRHDLDLHLAILVGDALPHATVASRREPPRLGHEVVAAEAHSRSNRSRFANLVQRKRARGLLVVAVGGGDKVKAGVVVIFKGRRAWRKLGQLIGAHLLLLCGGGGANGAQRQNQAGEGGV